MDPAEPKKPPRRRWFQYSLRSMLVLITLAAIALAAWNTYRKRLRLQNRALPELTRLKAEVDVQPVGPEWLRALPGGEDLFKVVGVKLEHHRFEDEDLACLEHLPYLERLYLAATPLSNKGLAHVAKCKRLKRLSLWKTRITDLGMEHLRNLEDLELLDIQETRVTEAALVHLRNLPRLRMLKQTIVLSDEGIELLARFRHRPVTSVHAYEITAQGMWALTALGRLEDLTIADSEIAPEAAAYFKYLGNLKHLSVLRTNWTDEALANLATLPRLESVYGAAECSDVSFRAFARAWGKRFTELMINGEYVNGHASKVHVSLRIGKSDTDLDGLRHFENLTKLNLAGEHYGDEALAHVAPLPRLEHLTLNTAISDQGIKHLATIKTLKWLCVVNPQCGSARSHLFSFSPGGLDPLKELTNLENLTLSCVALTDEHLGFLESMGKLKHLDLGYNSIVGPGLVHLAGCPQLEELSMNYCSGLDDGAMVYVAKLERLREVALRDTKVGDAGAERLHGHRRLETVIVRGSRVTPEGRQALQASLPNVRSVY
jgi:Leucine-rich repeat (LRR) protein